MSIASVMPSNPLILCCPLLLLPSIFPSFRVFSNESVLCIRWPKYQSFSINPFNEYTGLVSLGLTGLVSLLSKGLLRVFSNTTVQKHKFLHAQPSLWSNCHIHIWLLEKPQLVSKARSLLFSMLSRVVITFLPRSKHLLISWLQSPYAVILEPKKRKSVTLSFFTIYLPWSDGTRCHDLWFFEWCVLSQIFHSLSPSSSLLSSSLLSTIRVVSSVCMRLLIFLPAILIAAYELSSPAFHMT